MPTRKAPENLFDRNIQDLVRSGAVNQAEADTLYNGLKHHHPDIRVAFQHLTGQAAKYAYHGDVDTAKSMVRDTLEIHRQTEAFTHEIRRTFRRRSPKELI